MLMLLGFENQCLQVMVLSQTFIKTTHGRIPLFRFWVSWFQGNYAMQPSWELCSGGWTLRGLQGLWEGRWACRSKQSTAGSRTQHREKIDHTPLHLTIKNTNGGEATKNLKECIMAPHRQAFKAASLCTGSVPGLECSSVSEGPGSTPTKFPFRWGPQNILSLRPRLRGSLWGTGGWN